MKPVYILLYILINAFLSASSTEYHGCFGSESNGCCDKVELFPDDSLTLESSNGRVKDNWCDRVVIVRKNSDSYDECSGCSLTVQFIDHTTPFPTTLQLLQANYSSSSYFTSEMLFLEPVATYGAEGEEYFPTRVHSPGTVLKIAFTQPYNILYSSDNPDMRLKMVITTNIPPQSSSSNIGVIIGITVPLVVLFIVFNVVVYKLRQRRIAMMRAHLNSRLTAIMVDAALDAAVLQQVRARQQRQHAPHSPDPNDSIAPPSYTEAAPPPPKYEDIVLEDSAAPDNGRDDGQLVVNL